MPVSKWTMAEEGSKGVEIVGLDDKRQITAVFGCTMAGYHLKSYIPERLQDILPSVKFADNWHVTYTTNDRANEETTLAYINPSNASGHFSGLRVAHAHCGGPL